MKKKYTTPVATAIELNSEAPILTGSIEVECDSTNGVGTDATLTNRETWGAKLWDTNE